MLTVVNEEASARQDSTAGSPESSLIDEIVREGARRMLIAALLAEADAYCAQSAAERDQNGHRLVVRNGYAEPRQVMTARVRWR